MLRKSDPETIAPYLTDASNFSGGSAQEVIIPENSEELSSFLKSNKSPVTVAGAGTGVTASRIPLSGKIISLEKLNVIGGVADGSIEAGPAVSLKDLQDCLDGTPFFYPPNPTETLASIGGTLATNASGSRSFKFGATRDYILEGRVHLADGRSVHLARGQTINEPLKLDDGTEIEFPKVSYRSPPCKNAAGYYVQPGMDWLDLFIGSDGTLGIFSWMKLRLLPKPADFLSGILFFQEEDSCWNLVEGIRSQANKLISPCSLEYFDKFSLSRLKEKFSGIPDNSKCALFFEQDINKTEDYDPTLEAWYEFLEGRDVLLDDSWFAQSPKDLRKFHDFRHQLPLLLNEENSRNNRVKIGTDMAVSNDHFIDMMNFYRDELSQSQMEYVIFGHIGDNHLHINLLPGAEKMKKAGEVYMNLVEQVLKWGGTVSAEHGIGKLKKDYFMKMVGENGIEDLRLIKKTLDPNWLLGIGNLI